MGPGWMLPAFEYVPEPLPRSPSAHVTESFGSRHVSPRLDSPHQHVSPRHTSFAAAFAPNAPPVNSMSLNLANLKKSLQPLNRVSGLSIESPAARESQNSTWRSPRLDVAAKAALNARAAAGMEHNLLYGTAGGSPRCAGHVEYPTTSRQSYRPIHLPIGIPHDGPAFHMMAGPTTGAPATGSSTGIPSTGIPHRHVSWAC